MYDRNQLLVSGTETKVQFRYRNRSQIFFYETKTFFSFQSSKNFKSFSSSHFFLGDVCFYMLETKPRSSEIIWKHLKFGCKIGFKGPFMIKKYPILTTVTRFFLWNVVSVSVTVSAESISQFGFRFRYRTETKIVVSVIH